MTEKSKIGLRIDGGALRTFRIENGWSTQELERKSGVSKRTIESIEAGDDRRRYPNTLASLAEALGVPARKLIRDELLPKQESDVATSLATHSSTPLDIQLNVQPKPGVTKSWTIAGREEPFFFERATYRLTMRNVGHLPVLIDLIGLRWQDHHETYHPDITSSPSVTQLGRGGNWTVDMAFLGSSTCRLTSSVIYFDDDGNIKAMSRKGEFRAGDDESPTGTFANLLHFEKGPIILDVPPGYMREIHGSIEALPPGLFCIMLRLDYRMGDRSFTHWTSPFWIRHPKEGDVYWHDEPTED